MSFALFLTCCKSRHYCSSCWT